MQMKRSPANENRKVMLEPIKRKEQSIPQQMNSDKKYHKFPPHSKLPALNNESISSINIKSPKTVINEFVEGGDRMSAFKKHSTEQVNEASKDSQRGSVSKKKRSISTKKAELIEFSKDSISDFALLPKEITITQTNVG